MDFIVEPSVLVITDPVPIVIPPDPVNAPSIRLRLDPIVKLDAVEAPFPLDSVKVSSVLDPKGNGSIVPVPEMIRVELELGTSEPPVRE
jgi:hypothetical protein